MQSNEIAENIFKSIDIIIQKRLEKCNFDKTISCIIEDNSEAKSGKYLVSYGESKFYAYTESSKYLNGDSVYVLIPMGDFNENKFIIGIKR